MSSAEEPISDVDNDLEVMVIQEGEVQDIQNQEENVEETNENEENAETETKTVVKPKRVIRNPQPKLNEETLKGPKGLTAIEGYIERVKFKGRGHEEQDLNVLMKTYEYWCHRLFPKFPFDDCIARLEKLGTKKATQTHIKRIRLDINFDDDKPLLSDEEENETTGGFVDTYNDPFDQLLPTTSSEPALEMTEEQLERMRQNQERARRLREERLRKIRENTQNNLGESNQIITQSSQDSNVTKNSLEGTSQNIINERPNTHEDGNEFEPNHETTKGLDVNSTNDNGNCSQNESDKSNNPNENQLQQDNGDDMDGKSTTKKKKLVIESDSEDEVASETNKDETVKKNTRHNLESADDDELSNPNENEFENRLRQEDNEDDTDTLQLEVKNTTKKKKPVVESDSENEIMNKTDEHDRTVKNNTRYSLESAHDKELDNQLVTNTKSNIGTSDNSVLNCNGVVNTQNNSNGYIHFQNKGQIIHSKNETEENNVEDILNQINKDGDCPTGFDSDNNSVLNCNGGVNSQNNSNIHSQNKAQIINSENEMEENDVEDILSQINTDGDCPTGFDSVQDATLNETLDREVNQPMDATSEIM